MDIFVIIYIYTTDSEYIYLSKLTIYLHTHVFPNNKYYYRQMMARAIQ